MYTVLILFLEYMAILVLYVFVYNVQLYNYVCVLYRFILGCVVCNSVNGSSCAG